MATAIVVPELGDPAATGIVARWLKTVGDKVAKDEPVCELVVGSATVQVTAPATGLLRETAVGEGASVEQGTEIGTIAAPARPRPRREREQGQGTLVALVDLARLDKWRTAVREDFCFRESVDVSYLAVLVRAIAVCLAASPALNRTWQGGGLVDHEDAHVGVTLPAAESFLVPVVRSANRKSLAEIARELDALTPRAKWSRLAEAEMEGATFTVTNPGLFGSRQSTPTIYPPQVAVLAAGSIAKQAVVVDDAIAIRPTMNISLSFDQRAVDALQAGRFLQQLRQWLEQFAGDKEWKG
ncbi:MAG: 2-oxo acid dehydrogenase subunit E2 [Dehalococcoidales bacterium]|nr:2-oxo acid dehydrogenase subunit E2 [Dehalococcoidales bacterium]